MDHGAVSLRFFKLRGGGALQALTSRVSQIDPGAPGSSTSAQALRGTAAHGTPQATLLVDLMGDEDLNMEDSILTTGEKALYDLRKQDLMTSCQAYEGDWSASRAQQFLADLKRMEKALH